MSSGSSTIDPTEFNERTVNEAEPVTIPEEDPVSSEQRNLLNSYLSGRRTVIRRRRHRRRHHLWQPSPNVQMRVWIYERSSDTPMNRQHLNRIIFSIGRCIRSRRSVAAQPGIARPAINYSRHGNVIIIDVERDPRESRNPRDSNDPRNPSNSSNPGDSSNPRNPTDEYM